MLLTWLWSPSAVMVRLVMSPSALEIRLVRLSAVCWRLETSPSMLLTWLWSPWAVMVRLVMSPSALDTRRARPVASMASSVRFPSASEILA